MEKIIIIYEKLKELRNKGVKMKDISLTCKVTPSALSSLYKTILPAYIENIANGYEQNDALEESLSHVNNVSKRRFFDLITDLERLLDGVSVVRSGNTLVEGGLFYDDLKREALKHASNSFDYSGFYLGYSRCAYKDALQIEPMMIISPQHGEAMYKIACMNAQNQIYWGNGMFTNHQISYIFLNEQINSQMGLKVAYIQLPMFDSPKMIRGVYLSHDYSRNPLSRRVVYVKQEDISLDEFEKLSLQVKGVAELNTKEQSYYTYSCEIGDYILSSLSMASPDADIEELEHEKKVINI
ncbi:MAG: hypothetical protein R3Y04_04660 [Rikenellaceae bacterium]